MENLPVDLVLEILYRLPHKSVHRCTAVCKAWSSLISDPSFIHQYILRNFQFRRPTVSLYFRCPVNQYHITFDHGNSRLETSPQFSLSFLPQKNVRSIRYIGSCNGLVLCSTNPWEDTSSDSLLYYVCNPLTKHYIALPPPPPPIAYEVLQGFLCDPCSDKSCSRTRFKVVRLLHPDDSPRNDYSSVIAQIFDSETNQWSESELLQPSNCIVIVTEGQYTDAIECKGVLFWNLHGGVLAYDDQNQLRFIESPPEYRDIIFVEPQAWISVSQGNVRLCLCPDGEAMPSTWEIWRLVDDSETYKWCLEYRLPLNVKVPEFYCDTRSIHAVIVDPIESHIVYIVFCGKGGVVSFNLQSGQVRDFAKSGRGTFVLPNLMQVFVYEHPVWPTSVPKLPS